MKKKNGLTALRRHYGGNANRGTKMEHTKKAAGKNIRYCLKALQDANLVGTTKYVMDEKESIMGKCLTKKGVTDMDRIAAQLRKK